MPRPPPPPQRRQQRSDVQRRQRRRRRLHGPRPCSVLRSAAWTQRRPRRLRKQELQQRGPRHRRRLLLAKQRKTPSIQRPDPLLLSRLMLRPVRSRRPSRRARSQLRARPWRRRRAVAGVAVAAAVAAARAATEEAGHPACRHMVARTTGLWNSPTPTERCGPCLPTSRQV